VSNGLNLNKIIFNRLIGCGKTPPNFLVGQFLVVDCQSRSLLFKKKQRRRYASEDLQNSKEVILKSFPSHPIIFILLNLEIFLRLISTTYL
jgi:hypothetical protein